MTQIKPPVHGSNSFTCPHCGVLAMQWFKDLVYLGYQNNAEATQVSQSECFNCKKVLIWLDKILIYPSESTAVLPHEDMPEEIAAVFEEARSVFDKSPRAAAALLRLAIQLTCQALGKEGSNLNTDIGALVKDGLPLRVKKALDTVRVIGNHAVHPGQISVNDDRDTAIALFALVNYVIERMISEPAKIDELFEALPEGAKEAIEKRDSDKTVSA